MNENILTLSKAYKFEGETITELDFAGAEDMTPEDCASAYAYVKMRNSQVVQPETTNDFALYIAAQITKKPLEFMKTLRMKDAMRVKNKVIAAFFG